MLFSFVTCWIIGSGFWSCVGAFDQPLLQSFKALCRVCHELWCVSLSPILLIEPGPRKTTRPVAHHYLRLVTNLVPSTLNEEQPIKTEMDVDAAPVATEPEWMKDKKWCVSRFWKGANC